MTFISRNAEYCTVFIAATRANCPPIGFLDSGDPCEITARICFNDGGAQMALSAVAGDASENASIQSPTHSDTELRSSARKYECDFQFQFHRYSRKAVWKKVDS